MIRIDCDQGGPEWKMARLGIPTASKFDDIITPKTMKLSASSTKYALALIAEQLLGVPVDGGSSIGNGYTERGHTQEPLARSYYELQNDVDVELGGFVMTDDRRTGCSPDGFVGTNGIVEFKSPGPVNHISYLLAEQGIGYRCQVQGQLWICERDWCDTVSYHPDMPAAHVRANRDEAFIKLLSTTVYQFVEYIDELKLKLQKKGLRLSTEPLHLRAL